MPTRRTWHLLILFGLMLWGTFTAVSLPLVASPVHRISTTIVISQVYGGGGNTNAPYQNDFIELFNRGTTNVSLAGWSVQYASSAGSTWTRTDLASVSLAPGQYYLIKQNGGATGIPLPTADVTGTINLNATAGKIALVNNATTLSGTCPISNTSVVDFIGYGSGVSCFEGAARSPAPSDNTRAILRGTNGCTDTDQNGNDFGTGAPNPRNSATPPNGCSAPATFTSTATPTRTPTITPTPTPTFTPTPIPPAEKLLITEVLFDGTQADEGDEFIEIFNPTTRAVDLAHYKIGDEETRGGGEGMYRFPAGVTIAPNASLVIARNAAPFRARFGFAPHFELVTTGAFTDTEVTNLTKYSTWANGSLSLSNSGDEVLLLGPADEIVDSVAWGNGNFAAAGLQGDADTAAPKSLQRYAARDANNMTFDFFRGTPSPGTSIWLTTPPAANPGAAMPNGMFAFWGDLHSHSTTSDGNGPPRMAFAAARANGLHFFGLTDHDSWLTQAEWDEMGNAAREATVNGTFIALRGFEYTHSTHGHINVFNSNTWVSRGDPNYDTLSKFYAWLSTQPNVVAQFNHPDWQYGGDFFDFAYNSSVAEKIALQEIGNNARVPYKRFEPQYPQSLAKSWRVAPTNNSDHHDLSWGADSAHRVGALAPALTAANLLDAFRARRVFATEDANLALTLQAHNAWMGATITTASWISFTVTTRDPNPEPMWLELYDNGSRVATATFATSNVTWGIAVPGAPAHFYYARAVQGDGDVAFTAPIWTDNTPLPTPILPTETPRPSTWDLGHVTVDRARNAELNKRATLDGCVTAPPGVFSDRFFFLQDETGGIKIYLPARRGDFFPLALYDRVRLRGIVDSSFGERQLELEGADVIEPRGSCGNIAPREFATGAMTHAVEGWLGQTQGAASNLRVDEMDLNDGTGAARIDIDPTTRLRLQTTWRSQIVRVIGIVSRAAGKTVLLPRYESDLIWVRAAATPTRGVARAATTPARASPTHTLLPRVTATPTVKSYNRTDAFLPRATSAPAAVARDEWFAPAGYAAAIVGASTSTFAGIACFGVAYLLWQRRRKNGRD